MIKSIQPLQVKLCDGCLNPKLTPTSKYGPQIKPLNTLQTTATKGRTLNQYDRQSYYRCNLVDLLQGRPQHSNAPGLVPLPFGKWQMDIFFWRGYSSIKTLGYPGRRKLPLLKDQIATDWFDWLKQVSPGSAPQPLVEWSNSLYHLIISNWIYMSLFSNNYSYAMERINFPMYIIMIYC
jgi:hypothetical protein